MTPDHTHARRFLAVLSQGEPGTFQTFDDSGKRRSLARILQGTLGEHAPTLEHLNSQRAGVFCMVNEGDSRGRKAENVIRIRALFIDSDGAPLPIHTPLEPHLVVESSPGRFHVYWKVSGVELREFTPLQAALAEHYGTDPSITDLPRVMRLPGFYHCKREPFMVRLRESSSHPPFNRDEVLSAWPPLAKALEHHSKEERKREEAKARARHPRSLPTSTNLGHVERLLEGHCLAIESAPEGTRHDTLLRRARALGGYVAGGYLEPHEVEEALLESALICGLPEGEAVDAIRWGLENGANSPLELEREKLRSRRARIAERMRGWSRGGTE